jgi:hypothetical protein
MEARASLAYQYYHGNGCTPDLPKASKSHHHRCCTFDEHLLISWLVGWVGGVICIVVVVVGMWESCGDASETALHFLGLAYSGAHSGSGIAKPDWPKAS